MTETQPILIYGAYGYTGLLVAALAKEHGIPAIVAGRREAPLRDVAEKHGLPMRVFDLDQKAAQHLQGIGAVLHCAGPFSKTAAPMVDACIEAGVHYLDITGEIAVFEALHRRDERARQAGVSVLPGVGFDVVPTDCVGAHLTNRLPTATKLLLAFATTGRPSRGTIKSTIEKLGSPGLVRREGELTEVPPGYKTRQITFPMGIRNTVTIPWGDVFTAHITTGIADIEVYMANSRRLIRSMRWSRWAGPILRSSWVRDLLKQRVEASVFGPTAHERKQARCEIWGRVEDDAGRAFEATMITPDGYALTATTALEAAIRTRDGKTKPGFHTPVLAFGKDFALEHEGVHWHEEPHEVYATA